MAVLVNDEASVGPIANSLRDALSAEGLNVVPCYEGQLAGRDNDIRVFNVEHIKGLEFEAVFFVGVDMLAELKPGLFDKFLYVGCTRAATFLGLTCEGASLPGRMAEWRGSFVDDWR